MNLFSKIFRKSKEERLVEIINRLEQLAESIRQELFEIEADLKHYKKQLKQLQNSRNGKSDKNN